MLPFIGRWLVFLVLNLLAGGSATLWALRCASSHKGLVDYLANWTTVFLGLIVFVQTLLGALGVLGARNTMMVLAAIFVGSLLLFRRCGRDFSVPSQWDEDIHAASSVVRQNGAILCVAILVLWIASALGAAALASPSTFWDALSYHVPMVTTWSQTGFLQAIYLPFAEIANSYFPGNGELLYFWSFAAFKNDLLVRMVSLGMWLVLGLAQFRLCRKMGANRQASLFAAILFLTVPIVLAQATEPVLDTASAALFILALGHLYEFGRSGRFDDVALFSVASGLFVGVKYSAPAYVVMLCGALLYAASWQRANRSARWWFSCCFVFAVGLVALGGYWYVRNLVQTGSPLFPVEVSLLDWVVLPGTFPGSHYDYNRLAIHLDEIPAPDSLVAATRGLGFFFPLAAAASGLSMIGRLLGSCRYRRERHMACGYGLAREALLVALIVVSLGLYAVTPYSIMRYSVDEPVSVESLTVGMRLGMVAFAMCVPVIATVLSRRPRVLASAWLILPPAMVQSLISANEYSVLWGQVLTTKQLLVAGLVVMVGLAGHLVFRAWQPGTVRTSRQLMAGAAAFLVLAALGVGVGLHQLVQYREDHRYALYKKVYGHIADGWSWVGQNAYEARIAFTGFNLNYPLYGSQISNEVRYVNIAGDLDDRYDFYEGGDYRAAGSYAQWVVNLEEWTADYVAVGNGTVEETWIAEDEERFSLEYGNSEIRVYRVHPAEESDSAECWR